MTYFDILGLPASVDVDPAEVERRFREKSLEVHPDRLAGGDAAARRRAAEASATLNEAVKVLTDRAARAMYLLSLAGVDLRSEQAAHKVELPMEFLEEIMERREALDGARQRKDLPAAQAMASSVRTLEASALSAGEAALREGDTARATAALARVKYFRRFLEEVDALEDSLLELA